MPRRPQFKIVKRSAGDFKVEIPASVSATGKRERIIRADEKDATKVQRQLKKQYHEFGTQAGAVNPRLASEAYEAAELLKPFGATILEAAKEYIGKRKAAGATVPLSKAWDDYVEHLEAEGRRPSTIEDYDRDRKALPDWLFAREVATITGKDIEKACDASIKTKPLKRGPTWNRRLREIRAVFNYATNTDAKAARVKRKTPDIITFEQAKELMRLAEEEGCALPFSLLLFAGIRPDAKNGEISRITWDVMGEKYITLPVDDTKTSSTRQIPIMPNLRKWLDACEGDPIIPQNWRRTYREIRKKLGIEKKQDVLRHTFASNFYRLHGFNETAEAMGHSSVKTFETHYKSAVEPEEAQKMFTIAPKGVRVAKPRLLRVV
jgi:integrase